MKKKNLAILTAGLLILAISGCGGGGENMMDAGRSESYSAEAPAEIAEEAVAYDSAASLEEAGVAEGKSITSDNGIESVADTGRKLIKTVNLELQTKEFDTVVEGIAKNVRDIGGYVESSSVWGNSYTSVSTRSADYTARIPSDKLDEFIQIVDELGNVTYKSEGVEDVTLQYIDVESRKKSLETEQERLLELLEQAGNLEDLMAIESRLSEVRYELENYGSQKRLLDNQIDYSTVHISVSEVERITETGERGFFQEISDRFGDNLYAVGQGLRGFAIGLIGSLPILAVWAVVIGAIVLILRKVYKKKEVKTSKRYEKKTDSSVGGSADSEK